MICRCNIDWFYIEKTSQSIIYPQYRTRWRFPSRLANFQHECSKMHVRVFCSLQPKIEIIHHPCMHQLVIRFKYEYILSMQSFRILRGENYVSNYMIYLSCEVLTWNTSTPFTKHRPAYLYNFIIIWNIYRIDGEPYLQFY